MRFKRKVFVLGFLWLYCIIVLFYDLRILEARQIISGFSISDFFAIWAPALLPFIVFFLTKLPFDRNLANFYVLYIAYVSISLMVGFFNSNSLVYLFGDLYKSLFILAGIGLFNYTRANPNYFYGLASKVILTYAIMRLAIFFYFGTSFSRLYYGTIYDTLLVGFSFVYLSSVQNNEKSGVLRRKVLEVLPLLLVLMGQKKLVIVSLLVLILARLRSASVIMIGLIMIAGFSYFAKDIVLILSETRLRAFLSYRDLIQEEAQRIEEIVTCFRYWTRDWFTILFGDGFGATVNVYSIKEGYNVDLHSIHNSLIVTAVRSGIPGLIVFLWISGKAFSSFLFESKNRPIAAILFAAFVASQFSYTFMDEVFVGYIFAHLSLSRSLST